MKTISLFEHGTAIVSEAANSGQLTPAEVSLLERAQSDQEVKAFRWTGRNQIKATQFVGMLTAPGVRLEVLPKIDGINAAGTRHVLMRMIQSAWDVPVWDGALSSHEYQALDMLELLIRVFARRMLVLCRSGLARSYLPMQADLPRLRGKLNVTRQFTSLAAQPQILACRYEEFTSDNALNRLLLCAVAFLARCATQPDTQRMLNELRCHFESVSEVTASVALGPQINLDRTSQRWEPLATLARHFLTASYQTAHQGAQDGVSLLFDMNLLFEAYIAAVARRVCASMGYSVRAQGPIKHLAKASDRTNAFETHPDLTLSSGDQVVIIDTKWKRIDPKRPNHDVAQADAYQMHGYAHVYGSRLAVLLYPHHSGIASPPGQQTSWNFVSGGAALTVATVSLSNPHGCRDVLRELLNSPPEQSKLSAL